MQLIKKLKTEKRKNNLISFGLFLCSYCNKEVKKQLINGKRNKSCGCMRNNFAKTYKNAIKHNDSIKNSKYRKLYTIWINMKDRCYNNKYKGYKDYGGRGIKVCKEWKDDYLVFKNWALENNWNSYLTIDRIDNDGNYESNNCRFITTVENNRHRRCNKLNWRKVKQIRSLKRYIRIKNRLISKIFKISESSVSVVIHNKQWKIY